MSTHSFNAIFQDLFFVMELVYKSCGFYFTKPVADSESIDYAACSFNINHLRITYRSAKITPTKAGQFVTLWQRSTAGPIEPFHIKDEIDFFIISTRDNDRFGQFIFPKSVLHQQAIISDEHKEGKRAFRLYPPWGITLNKQAQKTQEWQLAYFVEISKDKPTNLTKIKALLNQ
jgi:hypothetical protein